MQILIDDFIFLTNAKQKLLKYVRFAAAAAKLKIESAEIAMDI